MLVNLISFIKTLPSLENTSFISSFYRMMVCIDNKRTENLRYIKIEQGIPVSDLVKNLPASLERVFWWPVKMSEDGHSVYTYKRLVDFFSPNKIVCMTSTKFVAWRLRELGLPEKATEVQRLVRLMAGNVAGRVELFESSEIVEKYRWLDCHGLSSCMTKRTSAYDSDMHPMHLFTGSYVVLAIVYDEDSKPIARCLVWRNRTPRIYAMYGMHDIAERALASVGIYYSSYAFDGLELPIIEQNYDNYLAPYIDGSADYFTATKHGTWLLSNSGDYCANNTGGLLIDDYATCDCCGDRYNSDSLTSVSSGDAICEYCLCNEYIYHSASGEYVHHDDVIAVIDGEAYLSECELYNDGFVCCSHSGDWVQLDDAVLCYASDDRHVADCYVIYNFKRYSRFYYIETSDGLRAITGNELEHLPGVMMSADGCLYTEDSGTSFDDSFTSLDSVEEA